MIAATGLAAPALLCPQPSAAPKVVVLLAHGSEARTRPVLDRLREELRKLGWVDGANLRLQVLYADGSRERLAENARMLATSKPAVIVTPSSDGALAVKALGNDIPVVFWGVPDPVKFGLVETLARPGRNFTGTSSIGLDVAPKLMEFARAIAPGGKRVGGIVNPANPSITLALKDVEQAAAAMGFGYRRFDVRDATEIEPAFRAIARAGIQVLHVASDLMLGDHYKLIARLAIDHRLPSVSIAHNWAEAGGLLSYGADLRAAQGDVARYVDRILRGARAAELPVQQATSLPMSINLRTAKALGVSIPQSLLVRADRLIE